MYLALSSLRSYTIFGGQTLLQYLLESVAAESMFESGLDSKLLVTLRYIFIQCINLFLSIKIG